MFHKIVYMSCPGVTIPNFLNDVFTVIFKLLGTVKCEGSKVHFPTVMFYFFLNISSTISQWIKVISSYFYIVLISYFMLIIFFIQKHLNTIIYFIISCMLIRLWCKHYFQLRITHVLKKIKLGMQQIGH